MKLIYFLLFLTVTSYWGYAQYATEIVVDQKGNGDFTSIQEAIYATKAFPEKDITIFIQNGIYHEKVTVFSWNNRLTLKGEHKDSTQIIWDDHFKKINLGRNSTFHTFTLKIEANDVSVENLTIINNAGPVGQAVALHLEGDRISFINCQIDGNQDTVYLSGEGSRHYFLDCLITGTTDFIFGEATALFQSCTIQSKSNSYITAASTPETIDFGFVFMDCRLTRLNQEVTEVYLGRPWRSFAKTVFINCEMGAHIKPEGWDNWGSEDKEATTYYAEYHSNGPGAASTSRVKWSHLLNEEEVSRYTFENIFREWDPNY